MALIPSLPDRSFLADVFQKFPQTLKPLLEYHDILLRGDSPLSIAEREIVAAYVSGLNACNYCFGAHKALAAAYDVEPELFDQLMNDVEGADIDEKLKPILRYVRKLTQTPSKMTQADADAVIAAGWDDQAIFDAVSVCALFNFMNRIIEGTGVEPQTEEERPSKEALKDRSYMDWGRSIGVIK